MNDENLIPNSKRTPSELREMCSKGGKASAKARRERKSLRQSLEIAMTIPLKPGKVTDLSKVKAFDKETMKKYNLTAEDAISVSLIKKALAGDVKAYEAIRDQLGERPVEEHRVAVVDEDKALEEWIKKMKADKTLKEEMKDD